jgi:hypothetical protein
MALLYRLDGTEGGEPVVDFGTFFRFENQQLVAFSESGEVTLAVADSFLLCDGRVRSLDAHFERFAGWIADEAPELSGSLSKFFELVRAALPRTGRWFPRLELHTESAEPELFLRLRNAPEPMGDVILWTYPEADPRSNPRVKGPDLSLGMQLRRQALLHGANETVLITPEGFVNECALRSLVWWRDGRLCAPGEELPWLDSITRQEVFAIANQMGIETHFEQVTPTEIAGLEIWLLSSLQGIKPVVGWVDELAQPLPVGKNFEAFTKRLRLLETNLG